MAVKPSRSANRVTSRMKAYFCVSLTSLRTSEKNMKLNWMPALAWLARTGAGAIPSKASMAWLMLMLMLTLSCCGVVMQRLWSWCATPLRCQIVGQREDSGVVNQPLRLYGLLETLFQAGCQHHRGNRIQSVILEGLRGVDALELEYLHHGIADQLREISPLLLRTFRRNLH